MLPTALSLQDNTSARLGPARALEAGGLSARSFKGRVARLQALFAEVARGADRYQKLDEREIATLASEEPPLGEPTCAAADPEDSSRASASEPEEPVCKQARVLDRKANYVIVELPGAIFWLHKAGASGCWMGRRRAFRNSRDYVARPAGPRVDTRLPAMLAPPLASFRG